MATHRYYSALHCTYSPLIYIIVGYLYSEQATIRDTAPPVRFNDVAVEKQVFLRHVSKACLLCVIYKVRAADE